MITSAEELATLLAQAQAGLARLLEGDPENPALLSAQRQLGHVAQWTRAGVQPTPVQREQLSFGLIAAREIEPLDLPLAEQLHALSSHFKGRPRG